VAKIGAGNPIPCQIGGGLSLAERAYHALRDAIGRDNCGDIDSLDGAWRWALARGIAAGVADERAVCQVWPDRATDAIAIYEDILHITAPSASSDEERRQEILRRWVQAVTAETEDLEAELQRVDPLFSILDGDRDTSASTTPGRGFEDFDPSDPSACGPAFGGGRYSTLFPNFSDDFVCIVQYNVALRGRHHAGALSAEQKRRIEQAKAILNQVLPAWVDFRIIANPSAGFVLDQSLLDFGAFGS